ncbi:MAG TPA: extracellular solute-binding protein [Defluviitaleaceae bacterium]|jgi:multiple sugar transport system substrate-binding protein|nr:extracellular solute-binding protein [Candidatus Epulonipiscium sp.]HOA81607.1 extracellular solute-binding protein [Defluviitaleaceae bacterium]
MKKRLVSILLMLVLVVSLAACGGGTKDNTTGENTSQGENTSKDDSKSQDKKLTVWLEKVFSDDANAELQERVKAFAEETGIEVKFELLAATDFVPKLNAAIEAGSNVPDVTLTSGAITKVLNYYPNIPNMDVTNLVSEIHASRPYFESIIEGSKIDGVNYFVPFYSSSTLMFIRTDKLAEKGITDYPTTWEEVFEVAEAVSDPKNGFYGLGVGCGPTDEDCENTFRMIMWNNGANIFNEDGTVAIDSENARKMINKYAEMYEKEIIPPSATTWDPGGNNSTYLMGESAIVFNAPTLYNALKGDEAYADILENTVALAPPAGTVNSAVMEFISGFAIMNTCKDVESAELFIKYMLDQEWYDSYFKITAPVFAPIFQDAENDEFWSEGINKEVVNYAKNASGYYGYPVKNIEGRVVAAKHYFTYPVAELLNSVVTGTRSVDEAISKMEADINQITSELK